MQDRPVALVTAAAGAGIGAAVARRLAADGLDVVVTDAHERRHSEVASRLAGEFGRPFASYQLDVTDHARIEEVTGTFVCTRHVLPPMIAAGGGSIVNISSIAAWEMSTDHGAAYSAAKAGVLALTRVTAAENGRHGVRVNAVAPGLIYNDFLRRIYPEEFFENYAETKSILGRVGRPDDVAELVAFLASEHSGYITGEVFGVSGGVSPRG